MAATPTKRPLLSGCPPSRILTTERPWERDCNRMSPIKESVTTADTTDRPDHVLDLSADGELKCRSPTERSHRFHVFSSP